MIFKKLNMEDAAFDLDSMKDLKALLQENCENNPHSGPMSDLAAGLVFGPNADSSSLATGSIYTSSLQSEQMTSTFKMRKKRGGHRRDQGAVVRDTLTALALCHNVTPTFPNPDDHSVVEFQASSPDEVALVKFANSMNMKLLDRD